MKGMRGWLLFGAAVGMCTASVARGQDALPAPAAVPLSVAEPVGMTMDHSGFLEDSVKPRKRTKAIEYSDWYARRLMIHKIGSYVMLPLFGAEYYLGEKLINGTATDRERSLHGGVAGGIGVLFGVNTITGLWNLYDSRKDPADRTKRIIHSTLMLAADAGFALAGATAGDEGREGNDSGQFGGNNQVSA
ncbi:MAG TPA: hypothetical protein VKO87_04970, partial [Gemmatimonadaceae bacterium]|nr:hypothetical protein [Gemmatimonadaceae bacterium]